MTEDFTVTEDMAKKGGACPVCKKFFKPNGVGGEGDILTPIIDNLPSSSILRYGCNFHDWFYHLRDNWGTREQADNEMYRLNKVKINKDISWYKKPFYHAMNYRNWLGVKIFGQKFWDKMDCTF